MIKKELVTKFYLNYRLYIFPAVVALSSLFLIVFAIYPQTVKLLDNRRLAEELINKSKFLETKVAALESYDEEDLSRKVGLVISSYPADKDFGNILGVLQQQARQFGFDIVSASLGSTAGKLENTESYEVKLEITGMRTLLSSFLNNLENSARLIRVKSIDVSSVSTSALGVTLSVEVLYAKTPQTFGSADSPLPTLSQKDEDMLTTLAATSGTPVTSVTSATSSVIPASPRGKLNPFE